MGVLQIPIGTFHKLMSSNDRSIVLNQVVKDEKFIPEKEFTPLSLRKRKDLQALRGKDPVYWVLEKII